MLARNNLKVKFTLRLIVVLPNTSWRLQEIFPNAISSSKIQAYTAARREELVQRPSTSPVNQSRHTSTQACDSVTLCLLMINSPAWNSCERMISSIFDENSSAICRRFPYDTKRLRLSMLGCGEVNANYNQGIVKTTCILDRTFCWQHSVIRQSHILHIITIWPSEHHTAIGWEALNNLVVHFHFEPSASIYISCQTSRRFFSLPFTFLLRAL